VQGRLLFGDIVGRIPLVFGITGHRDVVAEDIDYLRGSVKQLLQGYRSKFPCSPIIFISPLAEGADQIAAEAALDIEGVRLAAVLPMPKEEYVKDFKVAEVRSAFDRLVSKASWTYVTGWDLRNRDKLYQNCGRNVASSAHVLIAAWNGFDNEKIGGAADTANFKLRGCVDYNTAEQQDEAKYLSRNETGLVYNIPVRRHSEPSITPERKAYWTVAPGYTGISETSHEFKNVSEPDDVVSRLIERLNSEVVIPLSDVSSHSTDATCYVQAFKSRADKLAIYYKKRSALIIQFLFGTAVLFALSDPLNQLLHTKWTVLLQFGAIFSMWALWYYSHRLRLKDRYEDYRSLTEASRVQLAWQQSGLSLHVADSYLSSQMGELDWLRRAIRSLQIIDIWSLHVVRQPALGDLAHVRESWLKGQHDYYAGASSNKPGTIWRLTKDALRIAKYTKVFLTAAIVILGFAGLPSLGAFLPIELVSWFDKSEFKSSVAVEWAPFLGTLSLALAVALKAYGEIMGFATTSNRYQSMALVLKRAIEAFEQIERQLKADAVPRLQDLMRLVGSEALAENGDWIISHRQKDLKPPT
jgi:hypothetical protein